jgi:type IX secretion system PorP/SprF family membrane protein
MKIVSIKFYVVFIVFTFVCKAQQDSQFTGYMYSVQLFNPAYAGSRGGTSVNLIGRTQWLALDGSPKTSSVFIDTSLGNEDNVGLGISFSSDKIGPTSESMLNIDYAYSLNFLWSKLTFGLKAGVNNLEIDYSRLNIASSNDPFISSNKNKLKPRLGLGVYFNSDKYYLGFSTPNILKTKYYDDFQISNTSFSTVSDRNHYYALAGYVFDMSSNIKFKPASLVKIVRGSPIQWDLSANFLINYNLTLGISSRLDSSFSGIAGFQISESFFVALAYDYSTTQLRQFNDGTYEIIIRIDLFSSQGKILTPRFF